MCSLSLSKNNLNIPQQYREIQLSGEQHSPGRSPGGQRTLLPHTTRHSSPNSSLYKWQKRLRRKVIPEVGGNKTERIRTCDSSSHPPFYIDLFNIKDFYSLFSKKVFSQGRWVGTLDSFLGTHSLDKGQSVSITCFPLTMEVAALTDQVTLQVFNHHLSLKERKCLLSTSLFPIPCKALDSYTCSFSPLGAQTWCFPLHPHFPLHPL